ncbi:MAG TPA: permease-like cell division protein FtsX [Vicinamibacteria bacterium]|nr:permease-like cell division protein FtsX [Vicinamibacteria bacterium]
MKLLQTIGYSLEEAFVELWRNRLVNFVSVLTIAITLFIVGIFLSVSANLEALVSEWASRVQLTLYLDENVVPESEAHLSSLLQKSPEVESFQHVSKQEAMERFRSYFPELEALPDLLDENPLPASFEVNLSAAYRNAAQVRALATRFGSVEGVAEVDYDLLWVERLTTVIELMRVVGLAIGGALVIASMFTIFNVIKLTVYGRQEEIGIMRLVGATRGYIRGPFLVEGVLQGGLGSALALGLLYLCHQFLFVEALRRSQLLPAADWIRFAPPSAWTAIVLGGMGVGFVGSLLSVRKFLSSPV